MQELPFKLFGFSRLVEDNPMIMVFFSSFGVLALLFVLATLLRIIPALKIPINFLIGVFSIMLPIGFVISILFFFLDVSGIYILLSWFTLVIGCSLFILHHYTELRALISRINLMKRTGNH
ncbi:hypothetical protein FHU10_0231 [Serratia fonticola]|jgi:uncharacterized membrane protein|uniref:Uncharacterized protein n=1 Tax=Serratia fonticola TaxID=47917 RepID=A0A542D5K7_SERFO|nr:hypothetical protein [Serratia fonticola]TQI79670.1 hypothetical protein FHU09_2218 [Serratia fonticola]TQI98304.1 hypothetical protein FHU11_3829 [Serratia fonticola]TVZ67832.1 hypothetical protein FHU10_0231 [Serratia fonticola]